MDIWHILSKILIILGLNGARKTLEWSQLEGRVALDTWERLMF